MKNIITLLLFAIFLISCGKEDTNSVIEDCRDVEYDISFDLGLHDEVCFPDGNVLINTNIEHFLCPCQEDCDSELGLLVSFTTTTEISTIEKQFYTSMINNNRSVFNDHEITSFSYTYGSEGGNVPCDKEEFEPEKVVLTFTISKK